LGGAVVVKTLFMLLLLCSVARSETAVERGLYVLGASAVYVLYDYAVYAPNQWEAGTAEEITFRVSQLVLLGGLTWFLVEKFGWKTGIAFGTLYVSWNFDAAYYLLYGRGAWNSEVEGNTVTWARHTPAGWFETPTSGRTLKIQMAVGMVLSVALIL